ncbi:MAG: hypothetical protein GKS00_26150 [Alphaproteobacteria bacterium]|nr:hypothetical protein [Alphaproteobacteria bacterium]
MTNKQANLSGDETPGAGNRGAIVRMFGVILVILGTLDIMLSWRGAFEIVPFHVMLIAAGLLLCLIGAIRRQNRR